MAITIDWGNKIINIAKNDLTLIQTNPTEIRELNINWFRLQLKALEESADGIWALDTHTHNTEVTLGGLTFARVVSIINGYTVTFENGAYAVNMVGANSNIGDVVNVNNVSVRSQNSAGLISTPLIEHASFEGGVWVDVVNGTDGTIHPIGTRLRPVKSLNDAKLIAEYRGFNVIYIIGDIEIDNNLNFTRYVFEGQTHVNNKATVMSDANVFNAVFRELHVSGVLDGGNHIINCIISNLSYVNGHIHNCGLIGSIILDGNANAIIADCTTLDPMDPPYIDMGESGQNLIMPNYSGLLHIVNIDSTNFIGIGLNAGAVVLHSDSVLSGTIQISGIGTLTDENGNPIRTGTWNGGVTVINDLVNNDTISQAVWDEQMNDHNIAGTTGRVLVLRGFDNKVTVDTLDGEAGITFPIGTDSHPVNNIVDALTISNNNEISTFHIIGHLIATTDFNNFKFEGSSSASQDSFDFAGFIYDTVVFDNLKVTGEIHANNVEYRNCFLENVSNVSGEMAHCRLKDNILVKPNGYLSGVELVIEGDNTIIDLQNSAATVSLDVNSGIITFINAAAGSLIELNLRGGEIVLDASCVAGDFYVEGYGTLYNESAMNVTENHLLALETIPVYVWNDPLAAATIAANAGGGGGVSTSYNNMVVIDVINGISGIVLQTGTNKYPSNNLADAKTIADSLGIKIFYVIGNLTLTGVDISGFTIIGSNINTTITITGDISSDITIKGCTIQGTINDGLFAYSSFLKGVLNMSGYLFNCKLEDHVITLGNNKDTHIIDCVSGVINSTPATINMGNVGQGLNIVNYNGAIKITNKKGSETANICLNSGEVKFGSDVTNGVIIVRGSGEISQDLSKGAMIIDQLINSDYALKYRTPGGIVRQNS